MARPSLIGTDKEPATESIESTESPVDLRHGFVRQTYGGFSRLPNYHYKFTAESAEYQATEDTEVTEREKTKNIL